DFQRLCVPLVQQFGQSFQDDRGDLLRYAVGTGVRQDMAAHPFALDQLAPQRGGGGILLLCQSLLSSRFAPALFCIRKLEQQFAVGFLPAQFQNGLFPLDPFGGQLFQSHVAFSPYSSNSPSIIPLRYFPGSAMKSSHLARGWNSSCSISRYQSFLALGLHSNK